METNHNQIVSLIWNIADDVLRDVFLRGQYRDVILPMVVLRRLDALLEPTKEEVEEELQQQKELGLDEVDEDALILLLAHLIFEPVKDNLPKIISLYDPACGSGGMLTEGREYLLSIGVKSNAIQLSGTEINPETYAICKSDLIIKGVNPGGIFHGNTITGKELSEGQQEKSVLLSDGQKFGYMLTNPPYGKSWKTDKEKIYHEKTLLDHRFELPLSNFAGEQEVLDCTPRTSDGQLLFMLEEVDKMKLNALKIDELLYDKGEQELSKWFYQEFGEKVFMGLDGEVSAIKEYLNDNDIKMTDKKLAKLISTKEWKARRELMDAAKQLMHAIGTEVFMDYNAFAERVNKAAKQLKLSVSAAQLKTIARAMSETDPAAAAVIKKLHKRNSKDIEELENVYDIPESRLTDYGFCRNADGMFEEYEPDSELRDTEKIPVKEDIYEYFQREVRPYIADAWINLPPTKIGCEISFNKYFYKPTPLRSLEENERDILELDRQSQGFIQSLFENL